MIIHFRLASSLHISLDRALRVYATVYRLAGNGRPMCACTRLLEDSQSIIYDEDYLATLSLYLRMSSTHFYQSTPDEH